MGWVVHVLVAFANISICLCVHSIAPFGLTLTSQPSIDELHRFAFTEHDEIFHSMSPSSVGSKRSNQICADMRSQRVLTKKQYKLCRSDPGLPHVLMTAYKDMLEQCKIQFQHERWNCDDHMSRVRVLSKDFKEKSFLQSLTSAGLAVTFAKACDHGLLATCGCYPHNLADPACSNTVILGKQFAKRFLTVRGASRSKKKITLAVTIHNTKMAARLVGKLAVKECKCHGMSTSCTIKTCWTRTAPLSTVASALKVAYNNASPVSEFKNHFNTWRVPAKKRRELEFMEVTGKRDLKPMDMVYVEPSPDYCRPSRYGPGTSGRECNLVNNTCSVLCCGRGHTFIIVDVSTRCRCKMEWCCKVECEICESRETRTICN